MTHHQTDEHTRAIIDFEAQLEGCTIKTPDPPIACGRSYVRVSKFTEWLGSEATLRGNTTTQTSRLLEYAYRNWPQHARTMTRAKLFDSESPCIIIFCILLKVGWGELIHLFRKRQKVDKHLPIDLLSLKKIFGQIAQVPGLPRPLLTPDELAAAFDREQWQFCPATFDLDEDPDFHRKRIIPIFRKEIINMKGGTASLWQVEVLEEFVGKRLREVVKTSLYNGDQDHLGPRYHFALKVFNEGNRRICDNEIYAFTTLGAQDGMVRYLGGYNHQETDHTMVEPDIRSVKEERVKSTHNILLEYGDRDLDELFAARLPPVLQDEIEAFWKGLFKVADAIKEIHHLKISNDGIKKEYWGWHADIKPDNILEIQGIFKLADPGFAKFLEKAKEMSSSDPTANLSGGTYTFGAPERYPGRRGSGAVHQTIDIWSLGCVFSIAATWVALGYQGTRQYSKLRAKTIAGRIQRQRSQPLTNPRPPELEPGDYFHNALTVLPEITNWHDYLRSSLRRTDGITHQVLDLVDRHMLVGDPKSRMSSSAVCNQLAQMTRGLNKVRTPLPDSIVQFLLAVDEEIPANAVDPTSVEIETGPDRSLNAFHDRRFRKSKYLGAPLMKTTHRSFLKSTLINPIVAQEPSQTGPRSAYEVPVPIPQTMTDLSPLGFKVPQPTHEVAELEGSHAYNNNNDNENDNTSPPNPSRTSPVVFPRISSHPERPNIRTTKSQDVFQAREDMEKRKREKSSMKVFRTKPKDDLLSGYYNDRDIKFLVDNAESMKPHWGRAKYLLETLLMKAEGLDEDGVDLMFTQGSVKAENARGKSKILKKMDDPKAIPADGVYTDLKIRLQEIFDDYLRIVRSRKRSYEKTRKLTIIVLTDGIWGGTGDKEGVNQSIVKFALNLERIMERQITDRPVSIEFIQFGMDPDATFRLRQLDDNLIMDGIPDLVDTEHCNGDINKMLLGSFVEAYDAMEEEDASASKYQSSFGGSQQIREGFAHSPPPATSSPIPSTTGTGPFVAPDDPFRPQSGLGFVKNDVPQGMQYLHPAKAP
ncbi:MAG: hypothetical protein M1818_002194 [Claussenomyces sp. TS43310]|nr:MAG: hypothetical protein M1818_002194 [Claussenomyces sp. TS43310]